MYAPSAKFALKQEQETEAGQGRAEAAKDAQEMANQRRTHKTLQCTFCNGVAGMSWLRRQDRRGDT